MAIENIGRASEPSKNQEIEALRGLAILFVVFHHRDLLLFWGSEASKIVWKYFTFWPGVDLFFVISGFVISKDFLTKMFASPFASQKRRTILAFYVRRMFRLWPAAWTWVAVTVLLTWVSNKSGAWTELSLNLSGAKAAILQYYNYWEYWCNNHGGCSANSVYWSLSLEEQFYLAFPLLAFALGPRLIFVILPLMLVQLAWDRGVWTLPWAFRSDALLLGVIIFLVSTSNVYHRFGTLASRLGPITRWVLSPLLILGLATIPAEPYHIPWATGLIALVGGGLVFLASFDRGLVIRGAGMKALSWIGGRSYSIYLTHAVAFRLIHEGYVRFGFDTKSTSAHLAAIAGGLALTMLFTELSYRLIESPTRRLGRRLSDAYA